MPLHKVSALLGHASNSITADLYGHLAKSDYQRDTSASMGRLITFREDDGRDATDATDAHDAGNARRDDGSDEVAG